ncbi:hypothetical protein JAAARDRAFT_412973 [Jaapia argillacea MUCL 33604]|uniref:Uncharacterized protein n=1 Tax=Jaapia argillacea MUCL 33604 TaxID=933084 RepID=A0A067PUW6_9AGAM|nr:hypothetical protein JAAARDRAFT_412973 [Jaapia argillacea MUCL 33604]
MMILLQSPSLLTLLFDNVRLTNYNILMLPRLRFDDPNSSPTTLAELPYSSPSHSFLSRSPFPLLILARSRSSGSPKFPSIVMGSVHLKSSISLHHSQQLRCCEPWRPRGAEEVWGGGRCGVWLHQGREILEPFPVDVRGGGGGPRPLA